MTTSAVPQDFDPKGKLIYVEDLDGKGGLGAFNFGDLVILDPKSGARYVLTNDRFFDDHPSWSAQGRSKSRRRE
jgi:hypothetical protein